jgi:hypothetical protein
MERDYELQLRSLIVEVEEISNKFYKKLDELKDSFVDLAEHDKRIEDIPSNIEEIQDKVSDTESITSDLMSYLDNMEE